MYCSKCNNYIPENSKFCPICGSQLINTEDNNVENNRNSYNTLHYSTKTYVSCTDVIKGSNNIVKDNWKTIFLMIFTYILIIFVINLGFNFVKVLVAKNTINNSYSDSTGTVASGGLNNYTSSYISNDSSSSYNSQIPNNSLNNSSSYSGNSLNSYSNSYSGSSLNSYSNNYSGSSLNSYSNNYSGSSLNSYSNSYSGSSLNSYSNSYSGSSLDSYSNNYSGSSLDNYSNYYSNSDTPKNIFEDNKTNSSLISLLSSKMAKPLFSTVLVNLVLSFLTFIITLPLTYGLIAALTKVKRRREC